MIQLSDLLSISHNGHTAAGSEHFRDLGGDKENTLSLACQLKALAEGMPGDHIHYDESNSLEKGSLELIIERVK